jgi:HEAT repeat protein
MPGAGLAGRLLDLLKSRKALDRRAAVLSLGKIGSPVAVAALQSAADDRDDVGQRFAVEVRRTA